ncbi:MAG: AMP-binding protein, partial [Methylocystaceae bacterium]
MDNRRFDSWPLLDNYLEVTHTIPETFANAVTHVGDRPANIFKENEAWRTVTYSEWNGISREIGAALLSLGLQTNDRNSVFSHTCAQWGWSDIGNQMAGGTTVTIFPTLSDDEIIFIINHSAVKYIFTGTPVLVDRLQSLHTEIPGLEGIICLTEAFTGNEVDTWSLDQFRALGRKWQADHPVDLDARINSLQADDGATIIYTSGTTGKLKGARFTQKDCVVATWRALKMCAVGGTPVNFE